KAGGHGSLGRRCTQQGSAEGLRLRRGSPPERHSGILGIVFRNLALLGIERPERVRYHQLRSADHQRMVCRCGARAMDQRITGGRARSALFPSAQRSLLAFIRIFTPTVAAMEGEWLDSFHRTQMAAGLVALVVAP